MPMVKKSLGLAVPWRIISLLLALIVCFMWVNMHIALGGVSCQEELNRAIRAEEQVQELGHKLQQSRGSMCASCWEKEHALAKRVSELEKLLAASQSGQHGSGLAEMGVSAKSMSTNSQKAVSSRRFLQPAANRRMTEQLLSSLAADGATAVVMIACRRVAYLARAMTVLLRARREEQYFPLIISQDGFDKSMTNFIQSYYVDEGMAFHMHHAHEANAQQIARSFKGEVVSCGGHKEPNCDTCPRGHGASYCHGDCTWVNGSCSINAGYVYIAQHFGFALRTVFDKYGFQQAIFIEEDMEISPDFFAYFGGMLPILKKDPKLFCVSAWNDNGLETLVQDPKAAYRTDFFPGLGWMIMQSFWREVQDRWPGAYWDEFMRRPDVRQGRQCIRPEVSRSYTFGEEGTSEGQFFIQHLSNIKLNSVVVAWADENLGFLASVEAFDDYLAKKLQASSKVSTAEVAKYAHQGTSLRIEYSEPSGFKAVANVFNLMDDEKAGIRRMSYRGVVPFFWEGNRVFLYTQEWPQHLDG